MPPARPVGPVRQIVIVVVATLGLFVALLVLSLHASGPATAQAAPRAAQPAVVVLTAIADAQVSSVNPTTNFGSATAMELAWNADQESTRRALIVFELGSIPNGAYIASAKLKVKVTNSPGKGFVSLTAARADGAWNENGVTWNNQPLGASPYASASSDAGGAEALWDVTALVAAWKAGTYPNFGFLLHGPEGSPFQRTMATRESAAPELHVTYYASAPTPTATPTTDPLAISLGGGWGVPPDADGATPVPNLDLTVTGIELTQGIQCYQSQDSTCADNSVPLVMNRPTLARVYVQIVSGSLPNGRLNNVPVKLNIFMSGGRVYTYTSYIVARTNPQRGNLYDTANATFSIVGTGDNVLTMRAEVNPDRTIVETDYTNNRYPGGDIGVLGFNFADTPPLVVQTVGIGYANGSTVVAPPFLDTGNTFNFALQTFPVPDVVVIPTGFLAYLSQPIATNGDWWGIINLANAFRRVFYLPGAHYFALIDPAVPNPSGASGFALVPDPSDLTDGGWIASGIMGNGPTAAQELTHNFARNHAPGCAPVGVDSLWPPSTADDGRIGDVGWNRDNNTLLPSITKDFMGYCGPYWVSGYTAKAIFDRREATLGLVQAAANRPALNRDYVVVAGAVHTPNVVSTLPLYRVSLPEGSHDLAGTGSYTMELRAAGGELLFQRAFDTRHTGCSGDCDHQQSGFFETVPYTPTLHHIVFRQGASAIYTITASPHTPSVTLTTPNGGETWGQSTAHTVAWTANDGDADPLYYHVLFSRDNGVSWEPVAAYITHTTLTLHSTPFAGTAQARFRVLAMDGFNIGSDDSDGAFSVERKPPAALIHAPESEALVPRGIPIVLQGMALELEDGQIPGNDFVWSSDRDGEIGRGSALVWAGASAGAHNLTLTVRDSHGDTGVASVRVFVGSRLYLPSTLR